MSGAQESVTLNTFMVENSWPGGCCGGCNGQRRLLGGKSVGGLWMRAGRWNAAFCTSHVEPGLLSYLQACVVCFYLVIASVV